MRVVTLDCVLRLLKITQIDVKMTIPSDMKVNIVCCILYGMVLLI